MDAFWSRCISSITEAREEEKGTPIRVRNRPLLMLACSTFHVGWALAINLRTGGRIFDLLMACNPLYQGTLNTVSDRHCAPASTSHTCLHRVNLRGPSPATHQKSVRPGVQLQKLQAASVAEKPASQYVQQCSLSVADQSAHNPHQELTGTHTAEHTKKPCPPILDSSVWPLWAR